MDDARFDALIRSLFATFASARPRRDVAAALLGAALLLVPSGSASKKKRRKRKNKKRGSCGDCGFGTCEQGSCVCAGASELCRGTCVGGCIGEAIVSPLTCDCCQTGSDCGPGMPCCSGICQPSTGGGADFCVGRALGAACDFDTQCTSTVCPPDQCPLNRRPVCRNAACACPQGTETCGGACVPPCAGGNVRIPGTCSCCRRNGETCEGVTPCCSGDCDASQVPSRCAGLLPDAPCDFDEQCTSGSCTLGFCEG